MNDDASSTVAGFGFIFTGVFGLGFEDEEMVDLPSSFAGRQKLFWDTEECERRPAWSSTFVPFFPIADFFFVFPKLSFPSPMLLFSSSITGSMAVNGGLGGGTGGGGGGAAGGAVVAAVADCLTSSSF